MIIMMNQGKKERRIEECNGVLGSYQEVVQVIKPQCEAEGFMCGEVQNWQGMGVLECLSGGPKIITTYSPDYVSGVVQVSNVKSIINSSTLDYQVSMTLKNTDAVNSRVFIVEVTPSGTKGAKLWGWEWERSAACDSSKPYNRHTGATIGPDGTIGLTISIPTEDIVNNLGGGTYYMRLISYDECCNINPPCITVSPFFDIGFSKNIIAQVSYSGGTSYSNFLNLKSSYLSGGSLSSFISNANNWIGG